MSVHVGGAVTTAAEARRQPGTGGVGAGYHAEVVVRPSSAMADALALVAPGQPLRDGIERVLQANRGAAAGGG